MDENIKRCDNCGSACDINDTYCKKCMHSFKKTEKEREETVDYNEPAIEGVSTEDFKAFVDYHWKYYDKKFKKTKNKKWFFQPNFAALFFGPNWAFYRTMYAYGIILWVLPMVLSFILMIAVPTACRTQVQEFYDAREAYSEYLNNGGEKYDRYYVDGHMHSTPNPVYKELEAELDRTQKSLRNAQFIMRFPVLVAHVLLRLPANSMYKQHVKNNAGGGRRGTSKMSIFIGILVFEVVGLLVSVVFTWMPQINRFLDAFEQMIPFI